MGQGIVVSAKGQLQTRGMAPPLVSGAGSLTYSPTLARAESSANTQQPPLSQRLLSSSLRPTSGQLFCPSNLQMSSSASATTSCRQPSVWPTIRMLVASVCIMAMFASITLAAPAASKTSNQEMQPDKRSFDSFNSRGFTGFDKRAFDSFAGTFSGLDKRSFDSFNSRGFTGFDKRSPFDSFVGSGFTGMDKRNAFDSFNSRGFTGFDKRAFDSFNSRGFTGFD